MDDLPLLNEPVDAIVFDCDSTLSSIEGVDELAKACGHWEQVHAMTNKAMSETGVTQEIYKERMELIKPHLSQLEELGDTYYQNRAPDTRKTINFLDSLGKKIFILSAGLLPGVKAFGLKLGIAESAIYAIDIYFDEQGNYKGYEEDSVFISMDGKRRIIKDLMKFYPRIIHIGDGLNDIESRDIVTRFIGYGGICYRENVAKLCDFYATHPSLLAIAPLCVTREEVSKLNREQFEAFQQGVKYLQFMEKR